MKRNLREYLFCAKCGNKKRLDTTYVCDICKSIRHGLYRYCAVDGEPLPGPPSRSFVCAEHQSHRMRRAS